MTSKNEMVGVLTNFGQIIPVKRENKNSINYTVYPVIDINFYPDADKYLSKEINLINDEEEWSNIRKSEREKIFLIKKELGKKISSDENIKNEILSIVKSEKVTKFKKIELLTDIFKKMLPLTKKSLDGKVSSSVNFTNLELSDIVNEVINDNVENLLINNVIMEYSYNKNEIKDRDTESIWLNINDITNWFKKYESEDF
jgi:hypothetical protein